MKLIYQNKQATLRLSLVLIALAIFVAGCSGGTPTALPTTTTAPTAVALEPTSPGPTNTPRPTPTPTASPKGSPTNPVSLAFILLPDETAAIDAAQEVALILSEESDLSVEIVIYPDFNSLSTAILNGDVDLFWLQPLEYLYLHNENAAELMLVTNHLGVYAYGVQFLANVERGFQTYYDRELNASFGDPVAALQQFAGTRPCFLNPDSLPGYYAPLGLLGTTSTPIQDPIFVYDYSAIVRALYIGGICDFGVSYALTGDARTAGDVVIDLPDASDAVQVVWQSDGIIPNLSLSSSPSLPLNLQVRLEEAFLDLQDAPDGLSRLSTALSYEVEALKDELDTFFDPLRGTLGPLELDLAALTRQTAE
ncbi:phosphate/phosphite/phosphonate ABC transporter substrate-binding protein [bacterium]|nr:phosphate/phosphite/phosphonate ABC transporter substrate-binding protein [bacterium]